MSNHSWDAEASVFQYPPLASANDDPEVVFQGTLRACFDMAAELSPETREHIEIETDVSVALYNGADVIGSFARASFGNSRKKGFVVRRVSLSSLFWIS